MSLLGDADPIAYAEGRPIVSRAKHQKPTHTEAPAPITWHRGWKKADTAPSENLTSSPAERPTDHPTHEYRQEQSRFGVEHRVELSTEPMMLTDNGDREPRYLTASLERQAGDAAPRVSIGFSEGVRMAATTDEARRFALQVLALADGRDV